MRRFSKLIILSLIPILFGCIVDEVDSIPDKDVQDVFQVNMHSFIFSSSMSFSVQ